MSSLLTHFLSNNLSALAKGIASVSLHSLQAQETLLRRMESRIFALSEA